MREYKDYKDIWYVISGLKKHPTVIHVFQIHVLQL